MVFYTDGIPEAMNLQKEQYGVNRLIELVKQHRALSPDQIQQQVIQDVRDYIGSQKVFDDITLMVCRRRSLNS